MNLQDEIKILPDYIANQIAAGEVVQRPESVVKELVENSIDAGAKSVAVVVRDAGKSLIHIIDDGRGMSRENLELALKRHATSKIKTSEDLERIRTFGFRGEALASIASVAVVEIRTRRESDEHGWRLLSEPNKEPAIEPVATEIGTQIFVRNLFYNVPARRKFLKSNLTEFRYISDTMVKFALAEPEIRFAFYDGDNFIFDVKPSSQRERVSAVLGKVTAEAIMEVNYSGEIVKVTGFLGKPHLAKQTGSNQYFFMNRRSIESRNLAHAIYSSYEHLLEKNQKPLFIINLEIDPEKVDVNVHPQKHEVKFEEERHIYNTLRKAVRMTLAENSLLPEFSINSAESPIESVPGERDFLVNSRTGEIVAPAPPSGAYGGGQTYYPPRIYQQEREKKFDVSAFDHLFGPNKREEREGQESAPLESAAPLPAEERAAEPPNLNYLQIHNKYIITQTERGALIVDQHNAHERVIYERAIKRLRSAARETQEVLFPARLPLSPSEIAVYREVKEDVEKLGFKIEETAEGALDIYGVPTDFNPEKAQGALLEALASWEENSALVALPKAERLAATYACKSAIKTGQQLSQLEMARLVEDLMKCETPYVCPHGRPVILEFTIPELDKQFGRTS
ncbi:MAG: DNA mismatch repair endonuclease MutL [Chloroflexota bacterium]